MFTIDDNFAEFERALSNAMQDQLPFAMSRALNDTANEIARGELPDEMQRVFDRPTRWTLRGFRYQWATKRRLAATVEPKQMMARRDYLRTQAEGGLRPQTGLERLLSARLRWAGQIVAVTPASGMRLDRYGNMSRGQLNQILSAIQAQGDPSSNTTRASRSRNAGRATYFVPRPGSRLSPGVWMRTRAGSLRKVLHFTSARPSYRKRLDVQRVGADHARDAFPAHLNLRLREAWATRRR
ncbi:hypothetical protein N0B44_15635 [Roseibacterium beibuensis]|uniref:Phage virion morphogenesis protein n=1 Tax=[Roseibacterium] beibuensis TaxID=1193142 RepID=A0ABP9L9Y8_9RHOB|nr:hypothetical protein [Roseibacterium beibuensis]